MIDRIVIATRESKLALWQAGFIREQLLRAAPGITVELLGMTTKGDRWLQAPLAEVGGKGLFVKELEEAILDGRADVAVHSMKDVPAAMPDGFVLPLIGFRADVRDALVVPSGVGLSDLAAGARVGSSSLRRQAMLLAVRPDLTMLPVRGNVGTRLSKLDAGEYDALVLAAAGLERLELGARITETLPVEVSLPAAGQGALGVECSASALELIELLHSLVDARVADCVIAERAVSAGIGADCSAPLGAYARQTDEGIHLQARLATPDGKRILRAEAMGSVASALGQEVAAQLLEQGAGDLLAALHSSGAH
jgi:hydroxymethylbilane synthase